MSKMERRRNMEVLLDVTVLFTLALALAFLIERVMEIVKSFYDLLDSRLDWYKCWTKKTYKLRNVLENKLRVVEFAGEKNTATVLNKFSEHLMNVNGDYSGTVPVLSGDLVRTVYIKSWFKVIGIVFGIGLAYLMKVDLVKTFQFAMEDTSFWEFNVESDLLKYVISGVVIGLGSNPLHKIISALEKKRKKREASAAHKTNEGGAK